DECLGQPMMAVLKDAIPDDVVFEHISQRFLEGDPDQEWIPQLASEGDWVIITSDRGRRGKIGVKLPVLCAKYGVSYAAFAASLHNQPAAQKLGALLSVWADVMKVHDAKPGSAFTIRFVPTKSGALVVALRPKHVNVKKKDRPR